MTFASSEAREAVSLVGLSAELIGGRAVIELHMSGPAEFHVNRFTTGDWISIWSDSFELSDGISEIPLELNRPELEELVTGAALVNEQRKATIRVYLGDGANRRGVFITEADDRLLVHIPAATEVSAAGSLPGPMMEAGAAITSGGQPELDAPPLVQPDVTARVSEAEVFAADPAPVTPEIAAAQPVQAERLSVGGGAPVDTGSFYLPRDEQAAATPTPEPVEPDTTPVVPPTKTTTPPTYAKPAVSPSSQADPPPVPFNAPVEPVESISQFENPASIAEMNYQYLRETAGTTDQDPETDDSAAGTPSLEEMMETATRVANEMLGEVYAEGAQPADATSTAGTAIRTTGGFYDPYKAMALVSAGIEPPGYSDSKEALDDIQIDLFEIVSSPLDQAITLLVAPTDYNIIVDSSVGSNTVSLSFKDSRTSLKNALDLLTRTYGLAYAVQANTIVVAAKSQIEGQLVDYETRLFVLSFADPMGIKTVLTTTNLLSEEQVEVYKGEEAYPQVNDSTELSTESGSENSEVKRIETNLSSSPRNALLVKAVPEQMVMIAEVINTLDRKPKIIELEVRVCQAGSTALQDLGISIQGNNSSTPVPIATTWSELADAGAMAGTLGNEDFSLGSFARSPLNFMMQLNSQIQEGSVEILAQPTLSTVDGKQAIYFAGERLPYISKVTQSAAGGAEVQVDFLSVGVTLNFKPRLDNDGMLTIDVNPIISSLLEFRQVGDLVEAPRTSSRQMATTVRVSDNEPFVLAGLINETERRTITKVPLLGDMPLLGKLFRNKNLKGERTEIIVVVIPHISD